MAKAKSAAAAGEKKTTSRTKKTTAAPTNGSNSHVVEVANVEEQIRNRAYQLFESRGRQHGNHQEDWFTAEAEVKGRTA